jgi:hypothetical protein
MKTMKLGDMIKRISEEDVNEKLKFGWKYTSKSEWKKNVRDVEKVKVDKTDTENTETSEKPKRFKKSKEKLT